ncbi:MAG: NRDE family protein, partial [Lysobacter sp.]|nr:NRDE family protein [Lysobacter sp.]
ALTRDASDVATLEPLLQALADTTPAPDAALPNTGVGLALERMLSPPFVRSDTYGTRCSTVVLVERGQLLFVERRYGPDARVCGQTLQVLALPESLD